MSEAHLNSLPRRNFITSGAAALTGLGLAGWTGSAAAASAIQADLFRAPMENGGYALPELPYAYDALEPAIDAQTMRLHHSLHFNSYKNGLNKALEKLAEARESDDFTYVQYWEGQLAFHGAGYMLHLVFFQNMAPAESTSPSDKLKQLMSDHFGSFEAMQKHFNAAAGAVEGSGWAILGFQPVGRKLIILQAEKHQNLTQWGIIPILALDVWEHAYYLKYQNRRAEYVKNFWSVVNWDNVEARATSAMQVFPA